MENVKLAGKISSADQQMTEELKKKYLLRVIQEKVCVEEQIFNSVLMGLACFTETLANEPA